jgi:hypothetical protein
MAYGSSSFLRYPAMPISISAIGRSKSSVLAAAARIAPGSRRSAWT